VEIPSHQTADGAAGDETWGERCRILPFTSTEIPVSGSSGCRYFGAWDKYRPAKTEVNITLKKVAAADLKIMTESLGTRLGKAFGASDVLLNSDEFDREFVIKTQDETFARTILNLPLQEKLLGMRQQKPRISLEGTWLAVSVPRVIRTEERYDELFELAFYITDQVLGPGF